MIIIKKSQLKPPLTKLSTKSLSITLYYVNIAKGLWFDFRKFFMTKSKRMAYSINKCEAGGALTLNFMTLRSMEIKLRGKEQSLCRNKKRHRKCLYNAL